MGRMTKAKPRSLAITGQFAGQAGRSVLTKANSPSSGARLGAGLWRYKAKEG
jgi:hypothetical protein